jgi:hypothetical protein
MISGFSTPPVITVRDMINDLFFYLNFLVKFNKGYYRLKYK